MAWTRRVREKKTQSQVLDFGFGQLNGWWYHYLRWGRLGENQVWVEIYSLWTKISHYLHWCKADPQGTCCSVTKSRPTLWLQPSRLPCPFYLPEFAQTDVHQVSDAIHPSHSLSPAFPTAFNLSQHRGLFQSIFESGGWHSRASASASSLILKMSMFTLAVSCLNGEGPDNSEHLKLFQSWTLRKNKAGPFPFRTRSPLLRRPQSLQFLPTSIATDQQANSHHQEGSKGVLNIISVGRKVENSHLCSSGLVQAVHSCSAVSDSLQLHGLYLTRLLCPWNVPGKNTGVGHHFLFQGIFPTQGSNLCPFAFPALAGRLFTAAPPEKTSLGYRSLQLKEKLLLGKKRKGTQ